MSDDLPSTEGLIVGPGVVAYNVPSLDGVVCEIQYGLQCGKPMAEKPGILGVGVVTLPNGQPAMLVQMKHPDGTSLTAVLKSADYITLAECFRDAGFKAAAIEEAAKEARRQ